MADNAVQRKSLTTSLVDIFNSNWAGGAFNVHDSVLTSGANAVSTDGSIYDSKYSKVIGFKIKQNQGESELKEVNDGVQSLQMSIYMQGFDNRKYM